MRHSHKASKPINPQTKANIKKGMLGVILGFLFVSITAGASLAAYGHHVQDVENQKLQTAFRIQKLNEDFDNNHKQFLADETMLKDLYSAKKSFEKIGIAGSDMHQATVSQIGEVIAEMQQLDKTQSNELNEIAELQHQLEQQ